MASISNHEEEHDTALALARRHKVLQQVERRRRRESVRMQLLLLPTVASYEDDTKRRRGADCQARELEILQLITTRRGFITQQLKSQASLRPLERWYHQLQLLVLKTRASREEAQDANPVNSDDEEEEHVTALVNLERVLAQDVACFDLQFASCTRVQDMATTLLDITQPQSLPEEILSFSTMKSGRVCRITCLGTSDSARVQQHEFHSSLLVQDFASRATQLLLKTADAHSLIDLLWSEPSA